MNSIPRLTLIILIMLFGITVVIGLYGWWDIYRNSATLNVMDALYHTLLAFTGDDSYIETRAGHDLNTPIEVARFTGLLTTISAIFGVAGLFLREQIKRLFASRRSDHVVIVGASDFVLNVFKSEKITLFDTAAAVPDRQQLPKAAVFLAGPITKTTGTQRSIGKPKAIVFGSKDTVLNVKRAQTWLAEMPDRAQDIRELMLRVEDRSVAHDLELLSDAFRSAQLVSRSDTTARALLTSMAPTELAIRRGQNRPHLVLVGLGSINLAVAEESALRCQRIGLGPLRLTIVDRDVEGAKQRVRQERPDLLALDETGVDVEFVPMDALECCSAGQADELLAIENNIPFTAIIVSTGDDTRNAAIAMRLRQLQVEQLRLRAPIYMRSDSLATVSSAIPTDLTGGILVFGGSALNNDDLELEGLHHHLAEMIHNRWRDLPFVEANEENKWENISTVARRSSYRAAMFALEIYYAAGFAPPPGQRLAGLRLESGAANHVLGDDDLIRDLSNLEHERWITERTLEGFRGTESYRDDEKKRHPLMLPFFQLPEGEEEKDERNVKETINLGIRLGEASPAAPRWRRLLRLGLIGPLSVDRKSTEEKVASVVEAILEDTPDLKAADLEILTPNAPGFDRHGAVALAQDWTRWTGRPVRISLMNAARVPMMDLIAAEALEPDQEVSMVDFAAQTDEIAALTTNGHHVATLDYRPLGVSDADLDNDRSRYFEVVKDVQTAIMDLADEMIFDREDGAKWTEAAIEHWSGLGKSKPHII